MGVVPPPTDAIAELARLWRRYEGDPDSAIRAITETAASALRVARASVWMLDVDRDELTCHDLYDAAAGTHARGPVLRSSEYPSYFAALADEDTIAAHDAHADPRLREFRHGYLAPLGIGALLDAPIRTGLRLVGVLCHEHVGGSRTWTATDQKDAAFLGSLASLTLELESRAAREALLAATLESTAEGILACDDQRVLAFNRRFVDMWGLELDALRDLAAVRAHVATHTDAATADALFEGGAHDAAVVELRDGRVFERSTRPQLVQDRVVGHVWSFRDVTVHRKPDAVYNRRYILEQLAQGDADRLTLALIAIDDFKKLTEHLGPAAGDAVLHDLASHLEQRVRGTDLVGRCGNEELVIALRGASVEAARKVLAQVQVTLGDRGERAELPRYTFSAGLATLGADGATPNEVLAKADERLYEAKRARRERNV